MSVSNAVSHLARRLQTVTVALAALSDFMIRRAQSATVAATHLSHKHITATRHKQILFCHKLGIIHRPRVRMKS